MWMNEWMDGWMERAAEKIKPCNISAHTHTYTSYYHYFIIIILVLLSLLYYYHYRVLLLSLFYPYHYHHYHNHSGKYPREIHVHCKRYELSALPEGDESLGYWIKARYKEKEALLSHYYRDNAYTFPNTPERTGPMPFAHMLGNALGVGFGLLMLLSFFALFFVWWWKYYTLTVCAFMFVNTVYGKGCDGLQELVLNDALVF